MKPVTVFSAFDGAGIGLLALKRAGISVAAYYASEVDKYAIQVAKKNHPEIIHVGDVKQCYARNFPKIDLLIGGSPCQDLSIAKAKREGLKGVRSGLFWHFVRLLRTMKPRYFLLENVASMSKADKAKITEVLGVEPILINSALVSAQQRKRLYWTNILGVTQPADKGILLKDVLENGMSDKDKSFCLDSNYWKSTATDNGLKYSLSHGRRTQVFQPVIYNPFNRSVKTDKANALGTRCDHLFSRTGQVAASPVKLGFVCGKDYQQNRVYSIKGKSVSLNGNGGGWGANTGLYKIDLPDGDYTVRKLTPVECERLQTWPDGYTEGVSNTRRYRLIGNGWTADVISHIFKFMKEAENDGQN